MFLADTPTWSARKAGHLMTETLEGMSSMPKQAVRAAKPGEAERAAVRELVKAARARGEDLTGPDGLLKSIATTVLESALQEMTEHLGGREKHEKRGTPAEGGSNIRNGTRAKTVLTDAAGEVTIEVPRDRAGSFAPVIVRKRQRRLDDVDAVAISLYAKGLTTGEICAHFAEVYGASISKDTTWRGTGTCSGCGPGTAAASRRSSRCSCSRTAQPGRAGRVLRRLRRPERAARRGHGGLP